MTADRGHHPSPSGRGVGGEGGEGHHGPLVLPANVLRFARALRQGQTDAESRLWAMLRHRRLGGWKFRRQHPIPPYVADFYCDEARLVIELDGSQHAAAVEHDDRRTRYLQARGLRVLRFWNNEVLTQTEAVLEHIWKTLHEPSPQPSPGAARHPLPEGEGGLPLGEGLGVREVRRPADSR